MEAQSNWARPDIAGHLRSLAGKLSHLYRWCGRFEGVLGIAHDRAGFVHHCESDSPGVVGAAASRPGIIEGIREGLEYVRVNGARDVRESIHAFSRHPFPLNLV